MITYLSAHLRAVSISVAIAAMACAPAHSAPLQEADTKSTADHAQARAIDEGSFVNINGMEQWITIRGRDRSNPVVLILHGGPGIALSGMAPFFADWEERYTLVQWDQPRSGSTAIRNVDKSPGEMTIQRFVRDAIAVADYARERLRQDKLILLGNSWGTLLGLEMVKQRPQWFSAYVGTSQAVDGLEGSRYGYQLALEAARARKDQTALSALEKAGPPPYATFEQFIVRQMYTNPPFLPASEKERVATAALIKLMMTPPPADATYVLHDAVPAGFNGEKNFLDTQREMFKEVEGWRARELGLSFPMPIFVVQGENDINTPVSLARQWLEKVQAPRKEFIVIPDAGHNTIAFAPEILKVLDEHVRPFVLAAQKTR